MSTERMLQICISLMAALGTLMLGSSQDSSSLPVVGVLAAALSLGFTDVLGWFRLNRYVGGAVGIAALLYSLSKAQNGGLEVQFISVANLLIHLQIILLFQKKERRIYWQLMVLSLMQVVVAAALNMFFLFGPLLVIYTAAALGAMLLFFIYRETEGFVGVWAPSMAAEPESEPEPQMAVIQVDQGRGLGTGVFSSVSVPRPRLDLVKGSLVRNYVMVAVSTALVSAAVFLLMPRFGDGVWRTQNSKSKTGYSDQVSLDDTSLYESPTIVMRVSLSEEGSRKPYRLVGDPYFRGGVMTEYRRGRWERDVELAETLSTLQPPQRIYSAVRQTVTMDSQRGGIVFSAAPACRLESTPATITINNPTHELVYKPADQDDPAQYVLGTLGFSNNKQTEFIPKRSDSIHAQRWEKNARRSHAELAAEADRIIQEGGLADVTVLSKARRLEQFFATSGLFTYSLDPSPDRNKQIDPVTDFVVNHRTGHCQYFASALAMMLRTQGISSRIVLGYRGGVYNAVGNYYQIREMDAHAWVEAVIPREEIPPDAVLPTEGLDGDAWVRLDPTPDSALALNVAAVGPWRTKVNDAVDYMQLLWSEYVLGLNQKRQREAIYEPIRNALRFMSSYMFGADVWAERLTELRGRFEGELFSRRNVQDALIAIVALTGLFYLLRFLARVGWKWGRRLWRAEDHTRRPKIEFYRRLEMLLASHGIRREPGQTQREFATAAEFRLRGHLGTPAIATIPLEIVDCFYRVRFGNEPLDAESAQRLDVRLGQLQRALSSHR